MDVSFVDGDEGLEVPRGGARRRVLGRARMAWEER
jgi:hypothetical protein